MALVAGSVTIDPDTAEVSGSGYARTLYDLEGAASPAPWIFLGDSAAIEASRLERGDDFDAAEYFAAIADAREKVATKCNAQAVATVALIQSATVTVPVSSTPTTAIGVVS